MTHTISSISEITRVGGWALRGMGYPLGVAERATRLLAWTQAIDGTAISNLRDLEAVIAASHQADQVKMRSSAFDRQIQAEGRHLLEVGPPAIDLATSDARLGGISHVDVKNVHGLNFAPALANLLAHRKMDALIVYTAGHLDTLAKDVPRSGWIMTTGSRGGPIFRRGGLSDQPGRFVREVFEAMHVPHGSEIASRIMGNAGEALRAPSPGYMSVTAIRPSQNQYPDIASLMNFSGSVDDFSLRMDDALRDGFPIALQDLNYLYALEMRTWAPTSERSRGQAGYGVF
jgi:hypothetical protein